MRAFVTVGIFVFAGSAMAQYTATILEDQEISQAYSGNGGNAGGWMNFKAGVWDAAGTFHDMHPGAGWAGSRVLGISGNQFVGEGQRTIDPGFTRRGLLWNGINTTPIDLTPISQSHSGLYATDGVNQVGYAGFTNGTARAYAWSGTADSAVALMPTGGINYGESYATDVQNGQAVGWAADPNTVTQAFYWSSLNPVGIVTLRPAGMAGAMATAIDGAFQYGHVFPTNPGLWHAARWQGSSDSFVDLNPAGYSTSFVNAAKGGIVAGFAFSISANQEHALAWIGDDVLDLHTLLPSGYANSRATAVDPVTGDIIGWGQLDTGPGLQYRAIRWTHAPVPEPTTCAALGLGFVALLKRRRSRKEA